MAKQIPLIQREISWLSFNERVLQEAADSSVPVLERLRFLGIYSNNLDEFFRVRVATVKRLADIGKKVKDTLHYKPKKILEEIQAVVMRQSKQFEEVYADIQQELQRQKIFIINETQLNTEQQAFVREHFNEHVRPALVPIMLNQLKKFPELKDKVIYLAIKLSKGKKKEFALVEVPTSVAARFTVVPSKDGNRYVMLVDDIIRFNLPEVFAIFNYENIEAYTIKITRDAELDIDNDISQSFLDKIQKSVKARQKGLPVRFVYDAAMPKDLLDFIKTKLKVNDLDNLIPGGRYHNFKDFMGFPKLGSGHLFYTPLKPIEHPLLRGSFFSVLKKQDVMLHYPYHSFSHFIDFLREAAIDAEVKSIQITLYRLAKRSMVVNALINAAKNGKQVTAIVELQARFDEEANIEWAKQLQEEGVQVIYGVPGLKVHSKMCLITRTEGGKPRRYANISTGNYNEVTSHVYADDALFTADTRITNELEQVFDFFQKNYKSHHYKHLILSPHHTRKRYAKLIENEIEHARHGRKSGIFLKMNSLVDEQMIELLYAASRAGVPVRLIVRGICALVPGNGSANGISDNIEAISIVDKFLEHSRIYIFENGGDAQVYIASADFMSRNLDNRIELTTPVFDKKLQQELRDMLELQWADNTKARVLDETQQNNHRTTASRKKVRAQEAIYELVKGLSA